MYETRFGLKRRPFPTTPDGSVYYPATEHEAVLGRLQRALEENEGFALLTGAPGTGKTLLGLNLLDRFEANSSNAFLTNSHFADRRGLLQAILYDLGLAHGEASEQTLRLRLTDFLLQNCQQGKKTLLVIDEAQHLCVDHLEELRLLGNLEAGNARAVQIVLLGQPGCADILNRTDLASLRQRLSLRLALEPLGVEEALDYLLHHLRMAGGRPERIADEAALEVLARGTHGFPRLLNQAAHQAFLLADAGDLSKVDAEAALEALAVLGLGEEQPVTEEWPEEESELDDDLPIRLVQESRRPA